MSTAKHSREKRASQRKGMNGSSAQVEVIPLAQEWTPTYEQQHPVVVMHTVP